MTIQNLLEHWIVCANGTDEKTEFEQDQDAENDDEELLFDQSVEWRGKDSESEENDPNSFNASNPERASHFSCVDKALSYA